MSNCSYSPRYHVNANEAIDELKKYMLVDGFDFVLDLDKSQGNRLIDGKNGKSYLDFFTFFASAPVGLNHPKMRDENFIKYMGAAAINKPSNSDIYTEGMATFVKTFFKTAVPEHFKYSFFIAGGALGVENALKTAFDWKVRKNYRKGYKEEKGHQIMHFKQAFHGRSGYTMSLTNTDPAKIDYFPKFNWPRITNPYLKFPLTEESIENTIKMEQIALAEMKQAFIDNKDDIAAIIIEPIQAEGGDNHFRNEFLAEIRKLADENEALLIFDEVQTGGGLTGTFWAHEQMEVIPDIMAFGKKMQVCGILATKKLDEIDDHVFRVSSRINSTWGGNYVDMIRSTKFLEIVEEERLVENVRELSAPFNDRIRKLSENYPDIISNPRGRGFFSAFDMDSPQRRDFFRHSCWENGLIVLSCGPQSIRFRPSLNLSMSELEEGFDIMEKVMKDMVM
jgi:L-lysine 6-transaminase